MQPAQPEAALTLSSLRIVFFAMIAGVLAFAAVVVLVLRPEPGIDDPAFLLTSLGALGVGLIVAWIVVGRILRQSLRVRVVEAPPDEQPAVIHRGFFTLSLVGAAMAEAFCLFALVVYMLTAAAAALLAAALGLAALLAQIPTADRFHRFTEEMRGHRPS